MTTDTQRRFAAEGRHDNAFRNELGQRVNDANDERRGGVRQITPDGTRKLGADGEYFLGIAVHDSTRLGHCEAPPDAFEQGLADVLFEYLDLAADRLRCQVQNLCRPGHAALPGHGPEILQVVVIQVPQDGIRDLSMFEKSGA